MSKVQKLRIPEKIKFKMAEWLKAHPRSGTMDIDDIMSEIAKAFPGVQINEHAVRRLCDLAEVHVKKRPCGPKCRGTHKSMSKNRGRRMSCIMREIAISMQNVLGEPIVSEASMAYLDYYANSITYDQLLERLRACGELKQEQED